jgi:hypothetical protein
VKLECKATENSKNEVLPVPESDVMVTGKYVLPKVKQLFVMSKINLPEK